MATSATRYLSLKTIVAVAVVGILLLGDKTKVLAEQAGDCEDTEGLAVLFACERSIRKEGPKVTPSLASCKLVKEIGMPCTCKFINKGIEDIINMEKLVFVAQSCGRPMAHGTKCGSYTVPVA